MKISLERVNPVALLWLFVQSLSIVLQLVSPIVYMIFLLFHFHYPSFFPFVSLQFNTYTVVLHSTTSSHQKVNLSLSLSHLIVNYMPKTSLSEYSFFLLLSVHNVMMKQEKKIKEEQGTWKMI